MKYSLLARSAIIASVAFLAASCVTQAQRQFQVIKTSNQENIADAKACLANVYKSPNNAPLRNHLPLSPSDVTLQQMSDTTFATPTEIQAIYAVHPQVQACRKSLLNGFAQSEPSLVPILVESYNKNEDDLLAVIQQKMTWGDFVRRVRDRSTETQAALMAEDRRFVSGLQQEHQAELAQRQRASEAVAAWAQTQEMINAANRPVFTNCNGFGNMVNCVTR